MKIALSLLVCLMLFASQVFSAPQNLVPLEKVSLQLKWFHQFQFAGYYAAKEQGYYAKEGLDVQILERSAKKEAVQQVLSGDVDFAVADSGILTYYARGEPLVALAAIFQHNPLVFIAKQSSGIMSPYEMRGKRIMLDTVEAGSAPLRAILAEASLNKKDYTPVKQSFRNDDLIEGKFDVMLAYLSDQPFYFQQKKIKINVINPQSFGIDFYGDILFTHQNELVSHPGRAEKFRRASLKGWQYALAHPKELIQLIHKKYHSKLSLKHLRFEAEVSRKLILPDLIPLGTIDVRRLQKVTDVYAQLKISKALTEDELAKFIYTDNSLSLTAQERAWLKAHPVIRLGIDKSFPPYEWLDEFGHYQGIAADYISLFEKILNVKFEIARNKSWAETLAMARRGELDMISCAVNTPQRQAYLNFTLPFIRTSVIIINDGRRGFVASLENLNGKRVAIEQGYFMQELLRRDYPKIQLLDTDSVEAALLKVAEGKADAYVGDAASANHVIQTSELLNLQFSGQTPYFSSHSLAISKRNPELTSIITKALKSISAVEQERIKQHWLSRPVLSGIKTLTVIKYGAGLLLILTIFAIWNLLLRREVARRKAIEQQLRNLLVAVEQNPASVVITDLNARLQYVNPEFTKATGYTLEEALGKNPRILHSGLTPAETYRQLWNDLTHGRVWHGELINQRKNGEHYWEDAHIAPVKNSDGVITNYVGVKIDITERKLMELAVKASELRFQAIIEASPIPLVLLDEYGNVTFINPVFVQTFGYDLNDAPTLDKWWPQAYPDPQYRQWVIETWQARLEQAEREQQTFQPLEVNLRCKNGEQKTAVASAAAISHTFKAEHLVVLYDITERKQIEINLKAAEENATAASRAKSEFLANMSHEIRTPMNAILGFTGILANLISDERQRYYLEAIKKSSKTLLQLINDILDLSKIEAGKFELNISKLSLKSVFDDITLVFSPQLTEKNIAFSLEIADNIPGCLLLDEVRLRQVLLNIIGNAVKFTEAGFIRVNVTMQPTNIAQYINLMIYIADSGIGIAQDQLESIFDAFTQQKQQNIRYGGTGLGLTISKRLTEMMGGGLQVESKVGLGSCFTLSLPQVEVCHSCENTDTPPQVSSKATLLTTLSAEPEATVQSESLPELVALLIANYQEAIVQLHNSEALQIDVLIDIAEQLLELSQQYCCEPLSKWASALKTQAELFDLAALPKTLSGFEQLLKQLVTTQPL